MDKEAIKKKPTRRSGKPQVKPVKKPTPTTGGKKDPGKKIVKINLQKLIASIGTKAGVVGSSVVGLGVVLDQLLRRTLDKTFTAKKEERRNNPLAVLNPLAGGQAWKPSFFNPTGKDSTDRLLFQTGALGGVGIAAGILAHTIHKRKRDTYLGGVGEEISRLEGMDRSGIPELTSSEEEDPLQLNSWKEASGDREGFSGGLPGVLSRNFGLPFAGPGDEDFWRYAGPVGGFGVGTLLGMVIAKKLEEGKDKPEEEDLLEKESMLSSLKSVQGLLALLTFVGTSYPAYKYFKSTDENKTAVDMLLRSYKDDILKRDSAISGLKGKLQEWVPREATQEISAPEGVKPAAPELDADVPIDTAAVEVEEEEKRVDPDDPFAELLGKM